LASHRAYVEKLAETKSHKIDVRDIPEEDYKNLNFNADPNNKNQGRFIPRRIAHEKFKNISSKRAQAELAEAEVGDFVFRPSTRSEDHITLTWKFWAKQFVHIDIQEFEKPKGASIGSRLAISSESFENLREIVERYIIPCNRLVREVVRSPKWVDTDRWEVVEETLKSEKNADRSRIPYRFVILP
jgi:transcription elongation factor SPT6